MKAAWEFVVDVAQALAFAWSLTGAFMIGTAPFWLAFYFLSRECR